MKHSASSYFIGGGFALVIPTALHAQTRFYDQQSLWWGGFVSLLFWIFFIVFIVWIVGALVGRRRDRYVADHKAMELLRERYVRGEIDETEFDRKKRKLLEK